jgi:hypothetical protein
MIVAKDHAPVIAAAGNVIKALGYKILNGRAITVITQPC